MGEAIIEKHFTAGYWIRIDLLSLHGTFPRCALLACWQCSWRTPHAAIHTTSKLGCTLRRKPKSQLLDTATVVTTHTYVTCKKQESRQRKHGQLWTLSTERFRSEVAHPFRYLCNHHHPMQALLLFSQLSPKPYFHSLPQSLHAWTTPAWTKTLFSLQHTSYYPGTTLSGVWVLTAVSVAHCHGRGVTHKHPASLITGRKKHSL